MIIVGKDSSYLVENTRIVAHVKSNLVPRMKEGLMFSLDENQSPPFQWVGTCEVNPDDLTDYEGANAASEERSKLDEAMDFLRKILADGPVPVPEVREQAVPFLFSERTLGRARKKLGVVSEQSGGGFSNEKKGWTWRLP